MVRGVIAMSDAERQKWQGRWEQVVGRAKSYWGQLTNNSALQFEGEYCRTMGWLKERAGEYRERLEQRLRG
jgi:uncharacterized protein YjbJ (UPF0337 family)